MANRGMFAGLFSPGFKDLRQEELDEEAQALALAKLDPFQAAAHTAYGAGKQIGRGLGEAVAGVMSKDVRTPMKKQSDAVEAAKAQVAQLGIDPDDPKSIDQFYRQVIMILQKQGLAAEALEVAKEYQAQKRTRTTDDLKERELQRKIDKDGVLAKNAEERNKILKASGIPEFQKYVDRIESETDPVTRKMYMDRINKMVDVSKGITFEDAGDRVIVRDRRSGTVIATDDKGAVPENEATRNKREDKEESGKSAYVNFMAELQRRYNSVADLYNHAGLAGIVGRLGRLVGEEGSVGQVSTTLASGATRGALALYKQVTGGTFLAGLAALKQASKTGASGLGAVSEKEGDKVQADAAALDRAQEAPEFRQRLATYAREIEMSAERLAAAAQGLQVPPVALQKRALTGPGKGAAPVAAPAAPAAAPAAAGWGIRKK